MKNAFAVLVLGVALTFAAWSCNQQPSGGSTLTLSKSRVAPNEYITIEHEGIVAGLPVTIDFAGAGGAVVTLQSEDVEQGRVGVAVPAFLDVTAGVIGAGEYLVTLRGLTGEARLEVDDLPLMDGVQPGAVLLLFLNAAIEDYQTTIENLNAIEAQVGGGQTVDAVADLNARIASLQEQITELETTGQMVVNLGTLGSPTMTAVELRTADRLLVSLLSGLGEVDSTSFKGSVTHRHAGECINPLNPPPDGPEACLAEVLRDIRAFTNQYGVRMAGYGTTGVGLLVTAFAATNPATGGVLMIGLITTTLGGYISFTDAALEGRNTDAFLQEVGEDFDAGLEALSQFGRVLTPLGSMALGALGGLASEIAEGLDNFVTFMDGYVDIRCGNQEQQKGRPRQQCTDICTFCEVTRPTGCDNSCATAFDGVCDDGGPDAPRSGCALGTDCLDCGARGQDDGSSSGTARPCCRENNFCEMLSESDCTAVGGRTLTDEPICVSSICTLEDYNGACCADGECFLTLGDFDCSFVYGGTYMGDGTHCVSTLCPAAEPAVEYVVWYTANVSCWSAPLMYITDRAGFERAEIASSYPGGGIDPNVPLEKAELQGGFASIEEARTWICPQFVSRFSHAWCSSYYQTANCNWQPGSLGCDLSALPFTDTLPAGTSCP